MLYSINQIQGKLAIDPLYKEKKSDIMKFFHFDNVFDNLGINKVFTHDDYAQIFLTKSDMEKIFNKASEKFNLPFDYKKVYEGSRPLLTLSENENSFKKYFISNKKDVEEVINIHYESSTYGKKEKEKEERRKEKKLKEAVALEKYIEEKKQKEWEVFDRATNLSRDILGSKIISIDFEFFLNKREKTHNVTELGITIHEKGSFASVHFLVEGEYQKKKNKALQQRFGFGETRVIPKEKLKPILDAVMKSADFILFHEQREDYEILNKLGVKIPDNVAVIDTQLCHKRYFREKGTPPNGETLENLLKRFKVESKDLHNAGNDSYFTLKLLLEMKKSVELNLEKTNKKSRKP